MFLKSLSIMEVKVTIGATPELTGLAVAVTNLINGQADFNLSGAVKNLISASAAPEDTKDEKPSKEEKPKATRNRKTTGKEEPVVQEPLNKEEEEEEKAKPVEVEAKDGSITIEDIRKIQRKVSLGGGVEKMKDLLATFGVESASELKESDYDAYYEKLVELV